MSKEYLEVYEAYKNGKTTLECPYPFTLEDNLRDEWLRGFNDAKQIRN